VLFGANTFKQLILDRHNEIIADALETLSLLSVEDFKKLRQASRLPAFFGSERVFQLYIALRSHYPDFSVSPGDLRKIYGKIFPDKKFSSHRLEKSFVELQKTTEAFLLNLELEKEEIFKARMTVIAVAERPYLFNLFSKTLDKIHEICSQEDLLKNTAHWYLQSELFDLLYSNKQHNKYDINDKTLESLNAACDHFFAHSIGPLILTKKASERVSSLFVEGIATAVQNSELADDKLLQLFFLQTKIDDPVIAEKVKELKAELTVSERDYFNHCIQLR